MMLPAVRPQVLRRRLQLSALTTLLLAAAPLSAQEVTPAIVVGDTVSGQLSNDDRRNDQRSTFEDRYVFEGVAGQTVIVRMQAQWDSYLFLYGPDGQLVMSDDDSGGNLQARIVTTLATSGPFTVVATSFSENTGPYTVSVAALDNAEIVWQPLAEGTLTIPPSESPAMTMPTLEPATGWTFEATAGERLRIRVHTPGAAPFLRLIQPSGLPYERVLNAYAPYDGSESGALVLDSPETGTWRVVLSAWAPLSGPASITLTRNVVPAEPIAVSPGATLAGVFSDESAVGTAGEPLVSYRVEVRAGQRISVQPLDESGPVHVQLRDPTGALVGVGGGGMPMPYHSHSTMYPGDMMPYGESPGGAAAAAAIAGTWQVDVSPPPGVMMAQGAFQLALEVTNPPRLRTERLRLDRETAGTLQDGDAFPAVGFGYVDLYELELSAGQQVTTTLRAGAEGPASISVISPLGHTVASGYTPTSGSSVLQVPASVAGKYLVQIGSSQPGSVSYTLVATQGTPATRPALQLGVPITSAFSEQDPAAPFSWQTGHAWPFEVATTGLYQLRMDSSSIDPVLDLYRDGVQIASNDDAEGLNSRITTRLTPGAYVVLARSFSDGAVGPYTLAVNAMEATSPQPVVLSSAGSYAGQVTNSVIPRPDTNERWVPHTLTLAAGQSVTLHVDYLGSDGSFAIYGADGADVAGSPHYVGMEGMRIPLSATRETTYTIVVVGYDWALPMDYTLVVR